MLSQKRLLYLLQEARKNNSGSTSNTFSILKEDEIKQILGLKEISLNSILEFLIDNINPIKENPIQYFSPTRNSIMNISKNDIDQRICNIKAKNAKIIETEYEYIIQVEDVDSLELEFYSKLDNLLLAQSYGTEKHYLLKSQALLDVGFTEHDLSMPILKESLSKFNFTSNKLIIILNWDYPEQYTALLDVPDIIDTVYVKVLTDDFMNSFKKGTTFYCQYNTASNTDGYTVQTVNIPSQF